MTDNTPKDDALVLPVPVPSGHLIYTSFGDGCDIASHRYLERISVKVYPGVSNHISITPVPGQDWHTDGEGWYVAESYDMAVEIARELRALGVLGADKLLRALRDDRLEAIRADLAQHRRVASTKVLPESPTESPAEEPAIPQRWWVVEATYDGESISLIVPGRTSGEAVGRTRDELLDLGLTTADTIINTSAQDLTISNLTMMLRDTRAFYQAEIDGNP